MLFLRSLFHKKARCFPLCEKIISDGYGLEIGGSSEIFNKRGILPIYSKIKRLDNCNFSSETIWGGKSVQDFTFDKKRNPGKLIISEASDLYTIPSLTYDFILSSHMIEHTANPLQALAEWKRVLKDNGNIVLIVPHKDGTFDRKRPVTQIDHIIKDFNNGTKEDDLSHLPEILKLHDLAKDPEAGSLLEFTERSKQNYKNRCLHQHVFNSKLIIQMMSYINIQIQAIENALPYHIIIIGKKTSPGEQSNNGEFLNHIEKHNNFNPFVFYG